MVNELLTVGITCFQEDFIKVKNSVSNLHSLNGVKLILHIDGNKSLQSKLQKEFKGFKNIKILNSKKNIGLGPSRNKIINSSNTKWITFLDAGDELIKENLKKQISFLKNSELNFINYKVITNNKKYNPYLSSNIDEYRELLIHLKHRSISTATIFNLDYLITNKIYFENKNIFHEDLIFSLKNIYSAKNFINLEVDLYIWNFQENSLSSSFSRKKFQDLKYIFKKRSKIINSNVPELKSKECFKLVNSFSYFVASIIKTSRQYYFLIFLLNFYISSLFFILKLKQAK